MRIKLDVKSGKIFYGDVEITPDAYFNDKWLKNLKLVYPDVKLRWNEYQKWSFESYIINSRYADKSENIDISFNFTMNREVDKFHHFKFISLSFSKHTFSNHDFLNPSFTFKEKLVYLRGRMSQLLQDITGTNSNFNDCNFLQLSPCMSVSLNRRKEIIYSMDFHLHTE